ncbi:hypothetical protein NtRootA4_29020 [Arthrobacter sp. NtRootA4]|nr:hypothetical protein NtRootA2_31210 [Arthrobacter sp. NtRootA2]BCW15923.1 hypothetical protein NtRootA4_29020 [Arthrobacter sp. NtRootA4]BCW24256.1 hypothetical protein NtRootC7_31230 [Arthrobacter sp. NtRootC7]BCW28524.1 hypothetical protein NtRootC45_31240 [Arthrobacter sp. NtRootC45]BCW32795.1 hypothetical protein NtRootD5_31260 [Arthrobacter sp. NtRootD5]
MSHEERREPELEPEPLDQRVKFVGVFRLAKVANVRFALVPQNAPELASWVGVQSGPELPTSEREEVDRAIMIIDVP